MRVSKDLTPGQMEAMALAHEDVPGPRVTDEQRYAEILASRKQRRIVSNFMTDSA